MLTIIGNHEPRLRDVDEAIPAAVQSIPFSRKPANPDRELETKLRGEAAGILRWMIEGVWIGRPGVAGPALTTAALGNATMLLDENEKPRPGGGPPAGLGNPGCYARLRNATQRGTVT